MGAVQIGVLFFFSVAFAIVFIAVIMICAMNRKAVGISAANIRKHINSFDPKRPLKDAFPRSRSAGRYVNEVMMPKTSTLLKPARDIVLDEMREVYAQNQNLLGQQGNFSNQHVDFDRLKKKYKNLQLKQINKLMELQSDRAVLNYLTKYDAKT